MIDLGPCLFTLIIGLVLVVPLALMVKTLLALEERVILPILRIRTMAGETYAITCRRVFHPSQSTNCSRAYVVTTPAKFVHPRRIS